LLLLYVTNCSHSIIISPIGNFSRTFDTQIKHIRHPLSYTIFIVKQYEFESGLCLLTRLFPVITKLYLSTNVLKMYFIFYSSSSHSKPYGEYAGYSFPFNKKQMGNGHIKLQKLLKNTIKVSLKSPYDSHSYIPSLLKQHNSSVKFKPLLINHFPLSWALQSNLVPLVTRHFCGTFMVLLWFH